jgi:hypothetical protein
MTLVQNQATTGDVAKAGERHVLRCPNDDRDPSTARMNSPTSDRPPAAPQRHVALSHGHTRHRIRLSYADASAVIGTHP